MTEKRSQFTIGHICLILINLLIHLKLTNGNHFFNDETSRAMYITGSPMAKGGWRPILSQDSLASYNLASILNGHTVGQKILTGPALIETKVISPHIMNVSPFASELFSNAIISTSSRPLVTRDASKLTTMPQSYKTSVFPQNSINLNAPVNTYFNPFSLPTGPGISTYKISSPFQHESGLFIKHQQPNMGHRPSYNKIQTQMMLGKRLKHQQMQNHMLQQLSSSSYHQPVYQNVLKKPTDAYPRPIEAYKRPVENYAKPSHHYVNPQESLQNQNQAKKKPSQNVTPVTYKPPYNAHFQQFGIKEEPFGPIPSSILGSFSSFGHASVKAREPVYQNKINNSQSVQYKQPPTTSATTTTTTTTKLPIVPTEPFTPLPTINNKVKLPVHEAQIVHYNKQQPIKHYNVNLSPPPKFESAFNSQNRTKEIRKPVVMHGDFIPSPPDPLNKHNNAPEILRTQATKVKHPEQYSSSNTNLQTRRPEISSFFDTTSSSVSTIDPFDIQSTKSVPENLLVQMPPPYTTITTFNVQPGKFENIAIKENYHIQHTKPPIKHNIREEVKYFPPTRGQELFNPKFVKHNSEISTKIPFKGYEVTENWGSSGEFNTQPTLHTWLNSAQSYKLFNTDLKPPPLPPKYNIPQNYDNRVIPVSYPSVGAFPERNRTSEFSTVYSTIESNKNHNDFFTQLENSLSSLEELQNKKHENEVIDLTSPINVSFDDKEKSLTTPIYDKTTIDYNNKRKPSKNKVIFEASTVGSLNDFNEFTTRYETFKEPVVEIDNPSNPSDLPTIPPNQHFKRPVTSTASSIDDWDDSRLRKKNKNRRRRPIKVTTTTEEPIQETDHPIRPHRYRTTLPPDVEEVTKPIRSRIRYPFYKSRLTTRPTSKPELTSSAQPTTIPTSPVTLRTRLHSRVRVTTLSSLDFEDLTEATTKGLKSIENTSKQSSIMKIAKEGYSNRLPAIKLHPYKGISETPDYSHKQDEKDTPTSDVSVNTYSAQKLKNELGFSDDNEDLDQNVNDSKISAVSDVRTEQTSPSYYDETLAGVNIETGQTTRSEQLFTEQKLGNRGNIRLENNLREKNKLDVNKDAVELSFDTEVSTTPLSANKTHRLKLKPSKYDRPRFSVKDYRNRLNQQTSTTDKPIPSEPTLATKLRFPTRSRFPSLKDHQNDNKQSGSEVSVSTENPRKKFTPKDPRHKNNDEPEKAENKEEKSDNENEQENEVTVKLSSKLRGGLRRDRIKTSTTESIDIDDASEKPISTYTNLKRPNVTRKRIQSKNVTEENSEPNTLEISSTTTELTKKDEKNETSTEKYTSETAIMKIAKEDRKHASNEEQVENSSMDQSQKVSDLTLAASKDYNTPGLFKSVSPNTRRIPNYFTIATDDPILPIEAFFPQLNQKKEN